MEKDAKETREKRAVYKQMQQTLKKMNAKEFIKMTLGGPDKYLKKRQDEERK